MPRSSASASGSDDEGFGSVFQVRSPSLVCAHSRKLTLSHCGVQEPEGFRPPTPPPTIRTYKRRALGGSGPLVGSDSVEVGLVSGHPLWGQLSSLLSNRANLTRYLHAGHVLYPAAIALAQFLELHAAQLLHGPDGKGKGKGKAVLELGAGGGLPGLVAALEGADQVRSFPVLLVQLRGTDRSGLCRSLSLTFRTPPWSTILPRTSR